MKHFANFAAVALAMMLSAQAQTPPAVMPLGDAIQAFNWKTDHIILATPPGITPSGPYWVSINVIGDSKSQLNRTVPLKEASHVSVERLGLPPNAVVLRLDADATWTTHVADIGAAMTAAKEKFEPGKRQLEVFFKVNFTIDEAMKPTYCGPNGRMPLPKLAVQKGDAQTLMQVDMGPGAPGLMKMLVAICEGETTADSAPDIRLTRSCAQRATT